MTDKLKEPILVEDIQRGKDGPIVNGRYKCGQFVKIRSCKEEHGDKTRLGIYLGDIAIGASAEWKQSGVDEKTGMKKMTLTVGMGHHNPAIFVPDLKEIVFGCESWWGAIESEDDLKQITNADINDVWYVKAMKELATQTS